MHALVTVPTPGACVATHEARLREHMCSGPNDCLDAAYINRWPCGLMDKALVFGTKDCSFESCQGHNYSLCMPLPTKLHSTVPRGAKTENRDGPQILKQRAWLFSACLSQRTRIFCLCH